MLQSSLIIIILGILRVCDVVSLQQHNWDECPVSFQRIGGRCYFYGYFKLNWWRAAEFCHSFGLGASLATIESPAENAFIEDFLLKFGDPNTGVWLGGSENGHYGIWAWFPTGGLVEWTNWGLGQPTGKDQHCMYIVGGQYGYQWADFHCGFQMTFLCEFENNVYSPWHLLGLPNKKLSTTSHLLAQSGTNSSRQPSSQTTASAGVSTSAENSLFTSLVSQGGLVSSLLQNASATDLQNLLTSLTDLDTTEPPPVLPPLAPPSAQSATVPKTTSGPLIIKSSLVKSQTRPPAEVTLVKSQTRPPAEVTLVSNHVNIGLPTRKEEPKTNMWTDEHIARTAVPEQNNLVNKPKNKHVKIDLSPDTDNINVLAKDAKSVVLEKAKGKTMKEVTRESLKNEVEKRDEAEYLSWRSQSLELADTRQNLNHGSILGALKRIIVSEPAVS